MSNSPAFFPSRGPNVSGSTSLISLVETGYPITLGILLLGELIAGNSELTNLITGVSELTPTTGGVSEVTPIMEGESELI